jgi:hypothetical protein
VNLHDLFNRGIRNSRVVERRVEETARELAKQMEICRAKWLDALYIDEIRAWDVLDGDAKQPITGLTTLLTLAGMCKTFDQQDHDCTEVRVIRGAISAAHQCARAGYRITVADARALSSAATRAREIFTTCSHDAMAHAATYLNASLKEAA